MEDATGPGGTNAQPNNSGNGSPQQINISMTVLKVFTDLKNRLQPWSIFFKFSKFGLPPGI